MKKIYIACALTKASEQYKAEIEHLKNTLRGKYEILDFFGLGEGSANEVYEHDIKAVKSCDLLVAECSLPSIGVGIEIATALYHNKPVLGAAKSDAPLGRMILGVTDHRFSFIRYNNLDDIMDAVEKKLEGII